MTIEQYKARQEKRRKQADKAIMYNQEFTPHDGTDQMPRYRADDRRFRWADSMAERFAEDEREYQARESAKSRIEEIDGEIESEYSDFRAVCKEIRANCEKLTGLDQMRKLIHREYRRVRSTVRGLRKEKSKLEDDFWAITPDY